jgi:hypothetical protein
VEEIDELRAENLLLRNENVALREQNGRLSGQLEYLRTSMATKTRFPPEWSLNDREERILEMMVSQPFVPCEAIHAMLYADREEGMRPSMSSVIVAISGLRKKLRPYAVAISSVRGRETYYIDKPSLDRLRKAVGSYEEYINKIKSTA